MNIIIIYSKATNLVRRMIFPDIGKTSEELVKLANCNSGEGIKIIEFSEYKQLNDFGLDTAQLLVGSPFDYRYAVIKQGKVTDIVHIDPLCGDVVKEAELLKSQEAQVGWEKIDGSLVNPNPILPVEEILL